MGKERKWLLRARLRAGLDACRLRPRATRSQLPASAATESLFIRTVADGAALRQDALDLAVRTRNNVDADQLADTARGRGTRVGRGLNRSDITADEYGHITGTDILFADKPNV